MESSGNSKGRLLTVGGVLSILAGLFQINNGVVLMVFFLTGGVWPNWWFPAFLPGIWFGFDYWAISAPGVIVELWSPPISYLIAGLCILVLGIVAIVGGISAIRRKRFGLSLAGAICALLTGLMGILAVIFVVLGKKEFRAKGKGNGI